MAALRDDAQGWELIRGCMAESDAYSLGIRMAEHKYALLTHELSEYSSVFKFGAYELYTVHARVIPIDHPAGWVLFEWLDEPSRAIFDALHAEPDRFFPYSCVWQGDDDTPRPPTAKSESALADLDAVAQQFRMPVPGDLVDIVPKNHDIRLQVELVDIEEASMVFVERTIHNVFDPKLENVVVLDAQGEMVAASLAVCGPIYLFDLHMRTAIARALEQTTGVSDNCLRLLAEQYPVSA